METVIKDRPYYRRSGGGLTLSGGECLFQYEFTRDLLRASKSAGINTAIESTASADFDKIKQILPYLDQYLLDIKHMNPEKHKKFTSVSNELILENARKISESGLTELSIRIPVVATFNDSVEEIRDIAKFADTLNKVARIHLLPYHRLGQDKYTGLGRDYELTELRPQSDEHMEVLRKTVQSVTNIPCQIGG